MPGHGLHDMPEAIAAVNMMKRELLQFMLVCAATAAAGAGFAWPADAGDAGDFDPARLRARQQAEAARHGRRHRTIESDQLSDGQREADSRAAARIRKTLLEQDRAYRARYDEQRQSHRSAGGRKSSNSNRNAPDEAQVVLAKEHNARLAAARTEAKRGERASAAKQLMAGCDNYVRFLTQQTGLKISNHRYDQSTGMCVVTDPDGREQMFQVSTLGDERSSPTRKR